LVIRGLLFLISLISLTVVVGDSGTYEAHNNESENVLVGLVSSLDVGLQADLLVVEQSTAGAAD
jgi:hypothetical protein